MLCDQKIIFIIIYVTFEFERSGCEMSSIWVEAASCLQKHRHLVTLFTYVGNSRSLGPCNTAFVVLCRRSTGRSVGNIINGRDPQTYCSDDLKIRPTRAVAKP